LKIVVIGCLGTSRCYWTRREFEGVIELLFFKKKRCHCLNEYLKAPSTQTCRIPRITQHIKEKGVNGGHVEKKGKPGGRSVSKAGYRCAGWIR